MSPKTQQPASLSTPIRVLVLLAGALFLYEVSSLLSEMGAQSAAAVDGGGQASYTSFYGASFQAEPAPAPAEETPAPAAAATTSSPAAASPPAAAPSTPMERLKLLSSGELPPPPDLAPCPISAQATAALPTPTAARSASSAALSHAPPSAPSVGSGDVASRAILDDMLTDVDPVARVLLNGEIACLHPMVRYLQYMHSRVADGKSGENLYIHWRDTKAEGLAATLRGSADIVVHAAMQQVKYFDSQNALFRDVLHRIFEQGCLPWARRPPAMVANNVPERTVSLWGDLARMNVNQLRESWNANKVKGNAVWIDRWIKPSKDGKRVNFAPYAVLLSAMYRPRLDYMQKLSDGMRGPFEGHPEPCEPSKCDVVSVHVRVSDHIMNAHTSNKQFKIPAKWASTLLGCSMRATHPGRPRRIILFASHGQVADQLVVAIRQQVKKDKVTGVSVASCHVLLDRKSHSMHTKHADPSKHAHVFDHAIQDLMAIATSDAVVRTKGHFALTAALFGGIGAARQFYVDLSAPGTSCKVNEHASFVYDIKKYHKAHQPHGAANLRTK